MEEEKPVETKTERELIDEATRTIRRQTLVYGAVGMILLALLVVYVVSLIAHPHDTVVSSVCVVDPHTYHLTNCVTTAK